MVYRDSLQENGSKWFWKNPKYCKRFLKIPKELQGTQKNLQDFNNKKKPQITSLSVYIDRALFYKHI